MNLLLWGSSRVKIPSAFQHTGRRRALVLKPSLVSNLSWSASNSPLFGLSQLSSPNRTPALLDGYTRAASQQTDQDLKTKRAARGSPFPVTNSILGEKAFYFTRSREHSVPMSLQVNAVMTQHGPFWWHWDSLGGTDVGSDIHCMPSCLRILLRVMATATGEAPNLSYAVLHPAVASFYPAVSLGV